MTAYRRIIRTEINVVALETTRQMGSSGLGGLRMGVKIQEGIDVDRYPPLTMLDHMKRSIFQRVLSSFSV